MPHNPSILSLSTAAEVITALFGALFIFAFILAVILVKVRKNPPQPAPKYPSQIPLFALTILISLILGAIFFIGAWAYISNNVPSPNNAIDIAVNAQRWEWSFTHPGKTMPVINGQLYIPAGRPIHLTLQSADVAHCFFVPDLNIKQDITPGQFSTASFTADQPGDYDIYCAEYCGDDHSRMHSILHVLPYNDWLKKMEDLSKWDDRFSPIEIGEQIYKTRGCMACHSVDGRRITGPTFKDMFGAPVELEGGKTLVVDDAYVRKSILEPSSDIVKGYTPQMPSFKGQISELDIAAVSAYFKSISANFKGDLEPFKRKGGASSQPTTQPTTKP